MATNVIVAVRVRPPNGSESVSETHRPIIQQLNAHSILFDPAYLPEGGKRAPGAKRQKDLQYKFDRVFGPDATQQDVYEETAKKVVSKVVQGFNASVFAYGATGSGKTHTMVGTESQPGVMVQCVRDLFAAVAAECAEAGDASRSSFELSLSYLEVYNENIRDLLVDNSGSLALNEDKDGCMSVRGLTTKANLRDPHEVFNLLKLGNARRTQCATDQNQQSSRSHAVLQITIKKFDRSNCSMSDASSSMVAAPELWSSKLSLIDLAGSERAAASTNKGSIQREGMNINRSLLALGQVINSLATRAKNEAKAASSSGTASGPASRAASAKKKTTAASASSSSSGASTARPKSALTSAVASTSHIPYRGSKLTRLLKDSLGGTCVTVMIAAVSPSSLSREDTHNTLKYSDRAKQIRVDARVTSAFLAAAAGSSSLLLAAAGRNNAAAAEELKQLRAQVQQLLKEKSEGKWSSSAPVSKRGSAVRGASSAATDDSESQAILASFRKKIQHLFAQKSHLDSQVSPLTTRSVQLTLLLNVQKSLVQSYASAAAQGLPNSPVARVTPGSLAALQAHIGSLESERQSVQARSKILQASSVNPWNQALANLRREITNDTTLQYKDELRKAIHNEIENRVQEATIREKDDIVSSYSMLVSQLTSQMHCTTNSLLNVLRFAFLNSSSSGGTTLFSPLTNPTHASFVQGVTRAVEEGLRGLLATGGEEDESPKAINMDAPFEPFTISMAAPSPSPQRSSRSGGRGPLPHHRVSTTSSLDEADEEASMISGPTAMMAATPARPTPTHNRYPSNHANSSSSVDSVVPAVPLAAFAAHAPSNMGPPLFTPLRHNRRSGAHHHQHHHAQPQPQQQQYAETARTPSRPPAISVASLSSSSDADVVMMLPQTPLATHDTKRMSTTPILRNKPLLLRPESNPAVASSQPQQPQQQQQQQPNAQTPTRRPLPHNYAIPMSSPRASSSASASSSTVAPLPVSFSAAINALQSSPGMPVSPLSKKQRTTPQASPSRPAQPAPQLQLGGGRVVNSIQVSQWESEMASLQSLQREVTEGAHHKHSAAAGGRGHKRRSGGQEKHNAAAALSASMPALPRALLMAQAAVVAAAPAATPAATSAPSPSLMASPAPAPAPVVPSSSSSSNLKSLQAKAKLLGGGGQLSHQRQPSGMLPPMTVPPSMLPPPSPAPSASLMQQQHTPSHNRSASALGTITLSSHSQSNSAAGSQAALLKGRPPLPLPKLAANSSAGTQQKLLKPLGAQAASSSFGDEPNENIAPPETPLTSRNRPGTAPLNPKGMDSPQQTPRLGQAKPKLLGALPLQHSESAHSLIPKPSPSLKKTSTLLGGNNRPLSAQAHSPMRRA